MADKSAISWTDATWNCITGCTKVSQGCKACYMFREYPRLARMGVRGYKGGSPEMVRCWPDKLDVPLRWKRPRKVFVVSMGDPFHKDVPDAFIDKIMAVMAMSDWHSYQLLTKRPERMRDYLSDSGLAFRIQRATDCILVDRAMRGVEEEWRQVIGFEGHYEVSNFGRLRSKTGRVLSPREHSQGYASVALSKYGEVTECLVHNLVLTAFDYPRAEGVETRHRNQDKRDNRIANLSWGTRTQNMDDASRHGTAGKWMKSRGTLTTEQVREIRSRRAKGEKLDDIAEAVGSNRKQVCGVALGKLYVEADLKLPLPQLWLGVSVEDQKTADERIPLLLQTPAAVRFVSLEPMLGPVDLGTWLPIHPYHFSDCYCAKCADNRITLGVDDGNTRWLDLVILGGESGPEARPFNSEWARNMVAQCKAAEVSCYVKQLGARPQDSLSRTKDWPEWRDRCHQLDNSTMWLRLKNRKGGDPSEWPEDLRVREFPEVK